MRSLVAKPKRERVQRAKVVMRTLWAISSNSAERESAAICGANQRAYAGPSDEANRNALFFEDFENSNVSDAASESTAERNANGREWPVGAAFPSAKLATKGLYRPNYLPQILHRNPTFLLCRGPQSAIPLSNKMP